MTTLKRQVATLQEHRVPTNTTLIGFSALVNTLDIQAPIRRPACVASQHVYRGVKEAAPWRIYDKRYDPGEGIGDHLEFAMRHEELDLLVLKRVLEALPPEIVRDYVTSTPTGIAPRRLWYWYEYLLGQRLAIPDAPKVAAVDLLDPKRYFVVPGELSSRHKVRNNMLGTRAFCPLIRRTPALGAFQAQCLAERAKNTIGRVSNQLIMRAASFMLLADSKATCVGV